MISKDMGRELLKKFVGCDSDNPGSSESPAVWLFGIEHGQELEETRNKSIEIGAIDDGYSIKTQLGRRYIFNKKAFKLLAAMNGFDVERFREFAYEYQPFVRGNSDGNQCIYFKGNLYPYACNNVHEWPEDVRNEIGISSKKEYMQWCRDHRLPVIKKWVDEYQPKIFIGVGITRRSEFSLAVFGKEVVFKEEMIADGTLTRPIYYFTEGARKLVVIPHFSGPYGLRSNELLRKAGKFVAELLKL